MTDSQPNPCCRRHSCTHDDQGRENFTTAFAEKFISAMHADRRLPGRNRPTDDQPFRVAGMLPGPHMSISNAENLVRIAKEQISQRDINASLVKAIAELTREVKRLDDDVHRARRDIQIGRRF